MRMIYAITSVLFIIVLFNGCISLRYFDPYYYEFLYSRKDAKRYIYDKKLYDTFIFNIHEHHEYLYGDKLMPNGYKLLMDSKVEKRGKRLTKVMRKFYYIDSHGKECLISSLVAFEYISYGLWLRGDEGGGFWFDTKEELEIDPQKNIYIENDNDK